MDCIVIDLSVHGARVALADVSRLGDHGLLAIPARFFRKACKVVRCLIVRHSSSMRARPKRYLESSLQKKGDGGCRCLTVSADRER